MITITDSSSVPTVVSCEILRPDRKERQYQARVYADLSNGSKEVILSFYEDEVAFTTEELIGLTVAQVNALFHEKDVAYMQAP